VKRTVKTIMVKRMFSIGRYISILEIKAPDVVSMISSLHVCSHLRTIMSPFNGRVGNQNCYKVNWINWM